MNERGWKQDLSAKEVAFSEFEYKYVWPLIMNTLGLRPLHYKKMAEIMAIRPEDIVVELGAGYPMWLLYANKNYRGKFISVDCLPEIQHASGKIIEVIRKFNPNAARSHIELLTADAKSIPLPENYTDIVVASNLPFLVKDYYSYIDEAYRVLKHCGHIYWSFAEVPGFIPVNEEVENYMLNAGFINIKKIPSTINPPIARNIITIGKKQ